MTTPIDEALSLAISIIEEARSDDRLYEAEAETVLEALRRSPPIGQGVGGEPLTVEQAWQDLVEKDDRTSPAEYPEMCLISYEELQDYMLSAAPAPLVVDRAENAPAALPSDVVERLRAVGRVEWGATAEKDDILHVGDFAKTLNITRETFGTDGPVAMHGLYIEGTETVICHTGTSPNSAQHARILTAAWNKLADEADLILAALNQGGESARDHERSDAHPEAERAVSPWITHGGAGQPLPDDAVVDLTLDDGSVVHEQRAGDWEWDHAQSDPFIVSYSPRTDLSPSPDHDGIGRKKDSKDE